MQVTKRVLLNKLLRFDVNYKVRHLQMRDFIFHCVLVLIQTQFTHFFKKSTPDHDVTDSMLSRSLP